MTDKDLKEIAVGGQPQWEETFEHRQFGKLTFKAKLPTALALARHSIEMDNLLTDLYGEARLGTQLIVAAIAGLKTLIELPVVSETRREDEDVPERVVIEKVYYDPEAETDETFLSEVWTSFSLWRTKFIDKVDELKNSSGETSGNGSSESSTATTDSPSTIHA